MVNKKENKFKTEIIIRRIREIFRNEITENKLLSTNAKDITFKLLDDSIMKALYEKYEQQ